MNIAVIGTGYVGLVTGTCFSEFGVNVTCVDKDQRKIADLNQGGIPIYEPGLEAMVNRNVKAGRLKFTTDLGEAVRHALVVFIAVGTPPKDDGTADLSYVEEVAKEIASTMDGYKVIVTKSTVPIGTGAWITKVIKQHQATAMDFDVVSNPEFLREGAAIEDFMRPNRVVIGANTHQAIAVMKDLYSPLYLIETPFVITNVESAELIKYAANAFLATKISFINEIATLCEQVGADVHHVAKGMGLDRRIGPKFLHPGPGYGGSCFPKDTRALVELAKEHGCHIQIVEAAVRVNHEQCQRCIAKISQILEADLVGKTIGILGVSFKPETDDIREAPAIEIVQALLEQGAHIRVFDPVAIPNFKTLFPDLTYCEDPYQVAEGSDALVFMTEWNQFRKLDMERIKTLLHALNIVDLRNIYEPDRLKQMGFHYICVGR
ncbi:MAG: UDP-glucose/GDP-mannose dehydrogenase family protein [Candidatus Vecturithrix sp.]|jgi:UDPglucose 6-dehydrogenase|nr:UDP-glucose/GDP-mannose dehydrogenase family protein [Candidatus Vecturithrix sp.]